jgi:hypothetical protein
LVAIFDRDAYLQRFTNDRFAQTVILNEGGLIIEWSKTPKNKGNAVNAS